MELIKAISKAESKMFNLSDKDKELLSGYCIIPTSKLVLASWQNRKDNEVKDSKLASNIEKNGQIINIQVRELDNGNYEVFDGKQRFKMLQDKPFVVCYNHGKITEEEAIRIAMETDIHYEVDNILLAELIDKLSDSFEIEELASTIDYTEEDLKDLTKLLDYDWDQFKNIDVSDDMITSHKLSLELSPELMEQWNELKECSEKNDIELLQFLMETVKGLNLPMFDRRLTTDNE